MCVYNVTNKMQVMFMYVCMCICTYVCMIHVRCSLFNECAIATSMYGNMYICACMYMYIYIYIYMRMLVCIYVCVCVCAAGVPA